MLPQTIKYEWIVTMSWPSGRPGTANQQTRLGTYTAPITMTREEIRSAIIDRAGTELGIDVTKIPASVLFMDFSPADQVVHLTGSNR